MEVKPDQSLHRAFFSVLEQALANFVVEVHERRFTPTMTATLKSLHGMIPAMLVDAEDNACFLEVSNLMASLVMMNPMVMRDHPSLQTNAVERCAAIATTIRGRSRSLYMRQAS